MNELSDLEKKRFTRHLVLSEIGEKGQLKLKKGRVLVVGTGGLGSPILYYLAAAGVGTLGLADDDVVDLSNLNRQILHSTPDIGREKILSAQQKLISLNPEINIIPISGRVTEDNVGTVTADYDMVVDATDNFATRFVLNEACVNAGKPFIHGGILGFTGQAMTILPGRGPCFRCIFHEPPTGAVPTAPGVLGAVAGTIGSVQAVEVVKLLLGQGLPLVGRLLIYDALEMSFREVNVQRNPDCPVCGVFEDKGP